MNKSIIQCLESDYKFAIEQLFTRIFSHEEEFNENELPQLRMEYMVDDHRDIYPVCSN